MTQGKETPNIGQTGVESIRIAGMALDDLPMAEAAKAKAQLPMAEEDARKGLIKAIKARYPTQDVEYLKSRIREARGNIARFREQMIRIGSDQERYRMLLHDVKKRDKQIQKARETLYGDDLASKIRSLETEYGPWQRKGLERQIEQFGASLRRFETTTKEEQVAIDKLTELVGLCKARDKELTRLGA